MIQVERLCKTYTVLKKRRGSLLRDRQRIEALDRISFAIPRGEICGYIGPNGAGKSTTIKILSGILYPDPGSGTCLVQGRVPWKNRVEHVKHIGVVFGQRSQLWWDLPARDSFALLADMYQVPRERVGPWLQRLIGELELESFLDQPVRQMSLGQRMRCELAAALVHNPPLLFLDEPTIGLDAPSKLALRRFIRWLNAEYGTTIILTTHDMDDIEALARRVLLIGKGRLLFDGDMQALRREAGERKRIVLDLSAQPERPLAESFADTPLALLEASGQRVVLGFDPELLPATEALRLAVSGLPVADLSVEGQPVEELIARLYSRHEL